MRFNYKFENKTGMMAYKYDNGKIYKITSPHTDKIYIGSTTTSLKQRYHSHKTNYNCSSIDILKHNDATIELIEDYPCNSRYELEQRERYYQEQYKNCIYKHKAGRTKEDAKQYMDKYNKIYQKENKTKLKKYNNDYYKKNRDKLLDKSNKYLDDHREQKKAYLKAYYIKNREKQLLDSKKTVICDVCKNSYRVGARKRHELTKKHINFINQN